MSLSDDDLRSAFAGGIYLHAVNGPLTHNAGCLIEGLLDLGVPVEISTDKVTSRPVSMPLKDVELDKMVAPPRHDHSGYVVDISHTNTFTPVEGVKTSRVAYLNQSDIGLFCSLPEQHLLFIAHSSTFAKKGGLRYPVAFGLSKGLIDSTDQRCAFSERRPIALRNFRATLSQSLRALLDISFVSMLERKIEIDWNNSGPGQYLNAMLNSKMCLAYGGDFYTPISTNPWFKKNQPDLAQVHTFIDMEVPALVQRWDSFRLWESFAAGTLAIHLNFDKYGFSLPEMPVAWTHYAPIDLDDIAGSVREILNREDKWAEIAEMGRAWAIAHYAPRPTAIRMLSTMLNYRKNSD